ncbi:MAG: methyltransferase domain-containing protein [Clostridium sp.]|uniref:glycosyltransferase n=1 Tax=Clostridium sp. TaxID=1506 RepID=UPI0029157E38|nr:glycosyltransferase [Clostridium sp.]MDU5111504.1 methyltransferase domain-containing protein [Clostridium sp.]
MDIIDIKNEIKSNIEALINEGDYKEAKRLIEDYCKFEDKDIDIITMLSIVFIYEENFEEAINLLEKELVYNKNNFDLLYNLAYAYELKGEAKESEYYYNVSLNLCENEELRSNIKLKLKELEKNNRSYNKKKIVFFDKGDDKFIKDIIESLSNDYETKKITVTNLRQIDIWMEWADICWFEWCDELVIYGSNSVLAPDKKIICRLHRYEAFTDYPSRVKWENIDKLIIVTEHLRLILRQTVKNIEDIVDIVTVNNGVNIDKIEFIEKNKGFNIGYVGYLHQRKNPILLLQIIKKLISVDKRYKLYIAGIFQDPLLRLYWDYQIKEMNLENNIIFDGWQEDITSWLRDKNYILSTSIHESFGYGIAEAMCNGTKPIIHNFVFSEEIWDRKYVFNTIDDAVSMIRSNNYNSMEYRNYIEDNYSLDKQVVLTKDLILNIDKKSEFNYSEYWNSRLNNKFDIEGVGYIGLGRIYNKYLYKSRFDILHKLENITFKNHNKANVLELGPGIGMFTEYFYKKNINYTGIDISERAISELTKKYKGFKFILGDISEKSNYGECKYDFIFTADVLLHLTNENKYKELISILSQSLSDEGYIMIFDSISTTKAESKSKHLVIRDINYIKLLLDENDLELVEMLPVTFFMNYPYDKILLNKGAELAEKIFFKVQEIFSDNSIDDKDKEKIGEFLYLLDKKALLENLPGLSQKVVLIKKKSNNKNINEKIDVNYIWNHTNIDKRYKEIVDFIEEEGQCVKKYLEIFEKSIEALKKS